MWCMYRKMKTVSLLTFSHPPNPLLKYEVAFCTVLVHSLPAPINSQIGRERSIFWGQSFPSSLLFKAAELSLLGTMSNTHSKRKYTHLAAVSSFVPPPENHTAGSILRFLAVAVRTPFPPPTPQPPRRLSLPQDSLSLHLQKTPKIIRANYVT